MRPSARRRLIVRSERTTGAILANRDEGHYGCWALELLQPVDPNERYYRRRRIARRRRRLRRTVAGFVLVGVAAGFAFAAHSLRQRTSGVKAVVVTKPVHHKQIVLRRAPTEIRGVHVSMPLANLPGKFKEYLALRVFGLNTIELDVKDETGEVAFVPSAGSLA